MSTGKVVSSNMIWRFLERSGAQLVTFIVSIILARILEPEMYGTVTLITVYTSVLLLFVESGLGSALIQKKDSDELDFSTIFYFNLIMGLLLFFLMYFFAPFIANFYNNTKLIPLIRVQSLILPISSVKIIQQTFVAKKMIFKKFFFATLTGTIGAAILGITMAYKGFGVWALVIQGLFNCAVDTLILWLTVKWRPKLIFSFTRLKTLYNFGWKIFAVSFIDTFYNKLHQLIIGKKYSPVDLSFYDKGNHFPEIITNNISNSINSVLVPTMSNNQDDIIRLKEITRKSIRIITYIMMPMMMGLAVCAHPLVIILLTEKWLPCIFFMRIFCFTFACRPIQSSNLNAINALGRSDIYLKLEIIKKIFGLIALISTMFISVKAMAFSLIITTLLNQFINSFSIKRIINYTYKEQTMDIIPQIFISLIMGSLVYCINFISINIYFILITQILTGIILYVLLSKIFKLDSYLYLVDLFKQYINKKR